MKEELIKKLQEIVKELTEEDIQIEITRTNDSSHGDFTSNVAMVLAKKLGRNPREVAEEIAGKFKEILKQVQDDSLGIEKVEVAGPGFINFYLSTEVVID